MAVFTVHVLLVKGISSVPLRKKSTVRNTHTHTVTHNYKLLASQLRFTGMPVMSVCELDTSLSLYHKPAQPFRHLMFPSLRVKFCDSIVFVHIFNFV